MVNKVEAAKKSSFYSGSAAKALPNSPPSNLVVTICFAVFLLLKEFALKYAYSAYYIREAAKTVLVATKAFPSPALSGRATEK